MHPLPPLQSYHANSRAEDGTMRKGGERGRGEKKEGEGEKRRMMTGATARSIEHARPERSECGARKKGRIHLAKSAAHKRARRGEEILKGGK